MEHQTLDSCYAADVSLKFTVNPNPTYLPFPVASPSRIYDWFSVDLHCKTFWNQTLFRMKQRHYMLIWQTVFIQVFSYCIMDVSYSLNSSLILSSWFTLSNLQLQQFIKRKNIYTSWHDANVFSVKKRFA